MKFKHLLLGAVFAASSLSVMAETVAIHTPMGFEVISISDNGKWACGNYFDYYNSSYAFRWNLDSGDIEMIGGSGTIAYGISDNGTVSGQFGDHEYLTTGVPVTLPGYYYDGKWHHIEIPEGVTASIAGHITADGRYMTGSLELNKIYTSFIWEDGKILRKFDTGRHNVCYGISPDGHSATGFDEVNNRYATYWPAEGDPIYFTDSNTGWHRSPWNYGRNFSPDGNLLVYWGGWNLEEDGSQTLWCQYNVKTGERSKVLVPSEDTSMEFDDIANDGSMVGIMNDRGCVYMDGKVMYIDDYLKSIGVDLTTYDDFYKGDEGYVGVLPIQRVLGMSADKKVFVLRYYNTLGQPTSMALKIDQDLSKPLPVEPTATQVEGLGTIALKWRNLVGVKNLRGYNIYRDGKKLNTIPLRVEAYYDSNLANGEYSYEIGAVTNDGVETKCEPVKGVVYIEQPINPPYNAYARAKGYDRAVLTWDAPMTNRLHKRWYDPASKDLEPFAVYQDVEVEMAIRFSKDEMAPYKGFTVKEVSFIPASKHPEWSVCFYTYDSSSNLQLVGSQVIDPETLKIGELNTITLDNPLEVPSGDLLAAVRVKVNSELPGIISSDGSKLKAGYSDLLRQTTEKDFFSTYEQSAASGYEIAYMAWAIDLGLEDPNYDPMANDIDHYTVYVDGNEAGTTDERTFTFEGLEAGTHTLSVDAAYKSGKNSATAEQTVTVNNVLPAVDYLDILVGHNGDNAAKATWEAPVDNDYQPLTYSYGDKPYISIKPNDLFMAGVKFSEEKIRGLDGYKIKTFRCYPTCRGIFTFILYRNDEVICEAEIKNLTVNAWNEIPVPEDITIDSKSEYLLAVDVFDPEPGEKVLGVEEGMPYTYVSDLFSQDGGTTWGSLTIEAGTHGNWMIGMTISDTAGEPFDVDGYDVLVDGKKVNDELVTSTSYVHNFDALDSKNHKMAVNTYYKGVSSPVEGKVNIFCLKKSGIDNINAEVADITLKQGANILKAEGNDIASITVYAVDGSVLASAQGNQVDITNIAQGVCLVKVTTTAGTSSSQKVHIHK